MKLNDKKFGKIFAEPNMPKSAEPRTEPKFRSFPSTYSGKICFVVPTQNDRVRLNQGTGQALISSLSGAHFPSCIGYNTYYLLLPNSSSLVKSFEETFMCKGFTPNISIDTHNKSNCTKSCIDNIFTKNIESVIKSGTIRTYIVSKYEIE